MEADISLVSIAGVVILIILSLVVAGLSTHSVHKSKEPIGQFIVLHEISTPVRVRNLHEGPTNLNDLAYYLGSNVANSPLRKSHTKKSKRSKSPKANRQ
jgi:hypothetical protein